MPTLEEVQAKPNFSDSLAEFWRRREIWSPDRGHFVFLANAVDKVGAAMFPEKWSADTPELAFLAARALARDPTLGPELERERIKGISDETYAVLAVFHRDAYRTSHGFAERFVAVCNWLAERMARGDIKSGSGGYYDGDVEPLSPGRWQSHINFSRFWTCQLFDPSNFDPFAPRIFVDGQDLTRQLAALPRAHQSNIYKTGAVGTPTSMHLVLAEARRMIDSGMKPPQTKRSWGDHLSSWLANTHPEAPRVTGKAITNNAKIKDLWWEWTRKRP